MTTRSLLLVSALSALTIALSSGCATSRTAGWETGAEGAGDKAAAAAALSEGKQLWKNRQDKADLEKALGRFEAAAKADPSSSETLTFLSRGYYLLADGHTDEKEEKKRLWEIGTGWGEKALALNPEFRKVVVDEKKNVEDALPVVKKNQIEPLYWTAVNLGKWARLSGLGTQLKYKDRIKKMIERVEKFDPNFFHGAVDRYFGTFYAVAPGFAGGSMEKSLQRFERAFKVANNYFGSHVLLAENYAVKKEDKGLFEKHLGFVLAGNPNSMPDLVPEQILEQRKAKKLMDQIEELF